MFKATTDTLWEAQCARQMSGATEASFDRWLNKAARPWQHLVNFWWQQQKAFVVDHIGEQDVYQSVKDEFFTVDHQSYKFRKKIPHKTWKRHSALLVYRQQAMGKQFLRKAPSR